MSTRYEPTSKETNTMTNIKSSIQKFAVSTLVVLFIAQAGAVAGAYIMHNIDQGNAKTTQAVAQALLKSVPTASAATSK
jgi:hypothetical protein